MEIKIACPTCQQHIAIDESWRGRSMECPSCHSSFGVPETSRSQRKNAARKPAIIIRGVIGLLILTSAMAIFVWRRSGDIEIISATYGAGTQVADVTARVREAFGKPPAQVFARPNSLETDPYPERSKTLVIVYTYKGHRHLFVTGEDGRASPTLLAEEALASRNIAGPSSLTTDALVSSADDMLINYNLPNFKQLLDTHPEILNQPYKNSRTTLLIAAAWWGRIGAVEYLLNRKADINARNAYGHTPLYGCISRSGTMEIVAMLLDHNADFTIPDSDGKTPLKLATEKGRQDIVDLLRQHGAKE
jgi:hypothetical protein